MAATDQTYRSQRHLDIVFGASCVLMLLSVVWMFAQDYYRDFKVEQREFRDVETALAERAMLNLLPDEERSQKIEAAVNELADALKGRNAKGDELNKQRRKILPDKVDREARAQAKKADLDSEMSLYNIAVEERNAATPGSSEYEKLSKHVEDKKEKVERLQKELTALQLMVEEKDRDLAKVNKEQKAALDRAVAAEAELKRLTADFDRFAKLTAQKRWKAGDWVRSLPVIDGFASPTRIQQYTLDGLPIDYNFKYVTRYDRCTTCHQGIDRPAYTKETIADLTKDPPEELQSRLDNAKRMIRHRRDVLKKVQEFPFDESDIPSRVSRVSISDARIAEFAAHPRLDLFVADNSPHPAEKFGCTICHAGQGSSTDFFNASHTPNDYEQEHNWKTTKDWMSNHYWDFAMLPKRFLESTCVKCHYQMTDLLPEGDKVEFRAGKKYDAPGAKVVHGYDIVRELGCFGCHEIPGIKDGRWVGPDLRLEPNPPLDSLSPEERAKAAADPLSPPGTMRKVGPSLRRIMEKTNPEWVRQWIDSPRTFRPDTKMPHFFHLSNNDKDALQGTGQEDFPEATIHAITFYLFRASEAALAKEGKLKDPTLPEGSKEDTMRGRQLFTEKGCLACHRHDGTTAAAPNLPAVVSEAHFAPDLSRLAAKLGTKPGDKTSARRWLIQWIKDPKQYHPRTFMPVTHLDDRDAADIAAWLLDQPAKGWDANDVPDPDKKTYENLARAFLNKALTRLEVAEIFDNPAKMAEGLQMVLDPLDKELAGKLDADGKLKIYIGRKSIIQSGCFGCHDIPGFETVKPIGTVLNDWGKKDPERLAFEDAIAYVKKTTGAVEGKVDENGHGFANQDGKLPYEKFYLEALEHHTREGFLHLKLREPRSYDYERIKTWDERLRMPQFRFTRGEVKPLEGESQEQAEQREEAEAREAVMTFILGLVAEPVPSHYVNESAGDRLAQVRGKQVLDKYNCAGCHQLRGGIYEFSAVPRMVEGEKKRLVLDELESTFNSLKNAPSVRSDNPFPDHNAWMGQLSANPERVTVHAIPAAKEEGDLLRIRLTQAVRFNKAEDLDLPLADRQQKAVDIPAAENLGLPASELLFKAEPAGGRFTDLMVPYLVARKADKLDDDPKARSGLPPPLLREGEKVQPGWLFQFLRNPYPIRTVTILRMPRFNMSDEEAQTLVNYFAAVDRASNQRLGLDYPYFKIPQRDEGFWSEHSQRYLDELKKNNQVEDRVSKLRPIWERVQRERTDELGDEIKAAEQALASAKDAEAKKKASDTRDALMAQQQKLAAADKQKDNAFVQQLRRQWESDDAYATDAYRLLVNANICLKCHQVGNWGQDPIGPRLDPASERLRPEWTTRWIANPQRLLVFPIGFHPMPQNFAADKTEFQDLFVGTARQQATAVSDALMSMPKVVNMPENRYYRPSPGVAP